MKVAVVQEWLYTYAGSERVLEQILNVFPEADLYSLIDFLPADGRAFVRGKQAQTSFVQNLPFAKQKHRLYLPLYPLAIEQFDLSSYDLVISNAFSVAKGVITGPDQLHISYIHSPMRYAWDLQHQYLAEAGLERGPRSWLVRLMLHFLRTWDARSANGVDHFIANSQFVARRVEKAYRRSAQVIYPPVDTHAFTLGDSKEEFYLTASRMVPYKKIPLIAAAFSRMPDKKLIIIGEGPEHANVAAQAGPNVSLLGYQSFDVLKDHLQRAKAFVFAAEEDFGILPLEAQACGTPVIAFGKGGALETVKGLEHSNPTGIFFDEQSPESIHEALKHFERVRERFKPEAIRRHAQTFSAERFKREFAATVQAQWETFESQKRVMKRDV